MNKEWPRIEGSLELDRIGQIDNINIVADLLQIRAMLCLEGFDPNDFYLCEYPAEGIYCCDQGLGKNYFTIDSTEGNLTPTYTTKNMDENGFNNFFCVTIRQSIEWTEC